MSGRVRIRQRGEIGAQEAQKVDAFVRALCERLGERFPAELRAAAAERIVRAYAEEAGVCGIPPPGWVRKFGREARRAFGPPREEGSERLPKIVPWWV